uniref:EF-hand domain family member B n=1 Tax=Mustela putorius furo TaxID=9669 RepID=M3YNV4_MUSPF
QSMEVGLTDEGKDDSGERGVLMGTKSPTELGFRVGLGKEDSSCRESLLDSNKFEERIASPETKSPLSKELEMKLKIQNLSRTLPERSNLGVYGVSASQETKSLGMLPGRMGLENDCLLAGCSGRMIQPHLGMVCESPQALGSRRGSVAGSFGGVRASLGKQPTLDLEPRQELGKETCVVIKPSTEMKPPVEVDTGLPKLEEPGPQIGLVIEPSESQFAQQPEERKEAENTEPGIEPPDRIRPIYSGKFFDRMPCWPTAGKVIPVGDRVATCLTEKLPRLITPPEAKKFFNYRYPPAGAERVFYGRAKDPQIAPYLTHGIRSKISIPIINLLRIGPFNKCTSFKYTIEAMFQNVYLSIHRCNISYIRQKNTALQDYFEWIHFLFGANLPSDLPARDVVNPPKSYEEVLKEGKEGHDLYIVSHNDYYYQGEAKNRKYNPSSFHRFNLYGVPTPHFNDGRAMAKTLYWLHELQIGLNGALSISSRGNSFKSKWSLRRFVFFDSIAETMNVPPDHTFGACLRAEEYGAGDLIHNRLPGEYLRGKDRQRALIAAVRHHLKKFNCQNFDTLLAAFRHYDKNGDGVIDKAELREACEQASLHLDDKLLDQLFDYCDVDNDGQINYLEFANFLNWKDRMPLKEHEERVIIKGKKPACANPDEANVEESEPTLLIKPEDIVLKEPGSSEKTLRTLLRPSDKVSSHYKTTSSEINAVVGALPSTCEYVTLFAEFLKYNQQT